MSVTTPVYAHEQRILACLQCGAPLAVAVEGGQFQCTYCGSVNQLLGRDESADLQAAQQATASGMSESERHERLREQDRKPQEPPESVQRYWGARRLNDQLVGEALQQWNADRQRTTQGAHFTVLERLFFLTLVLARQEAGTRQRAFLESAIEAQPDERYRQILRCRLVRNAVLAGELDAAKAWLARCNPRSTDLITDTEYRLARCFVAVAENDAVTMLELLGDTPDHVPIADGQDEVAGVLRVHALMLAGRQDEAKKQLKAWMLASSTSFGRVATFIHDHERLRLCGELYPPLEEKLWKRIRIKLTPAAEQNHRYAYGITLLVTIILGAGSGLVACWRKFGSDLDGWFWGGPAEFAAAVTFACIMAFFFLVSPLDKAHRAEPRDRRLRKTGKFGMARLVGRVPSDDWFQYKYELFTDEGQVFTFDKEGAWPHRLGDALPVLVDPENTDYSLIWDPQASE